MRRVVVSGVVVVAILACARAGSAANLVMNPGFETPASYIGPWATTTGVWKGDISQSVGAENGVTPIGSGMLKFVNTRWGPTYPNGATGDLLQFIDLTPYASQIAGGQAKVRYAARFNRVADSGTGTVDTLFGIRLYARNGTLSSFFDSSSPQLAAGETTVITDNDLGTWQEASGMLTIPSGATHLAIQVQARENIVNDVANEFAGHYADEVVVEFVPEPVGLSGLASAAIVVAAHRRRRRMLPS